MKQTSIEWLWEQIDNIVPYQDINAAQQFNQLLEQAKQMHKQEVTNCNHLEISDEEIEQWSRIKSVGKGYDGSRFQNTYEEGFIDAIKWYREQLKQIQ